MKRLQVPGKIVLIGEYGVIDGGKALLAALRPPFVFERGDLDNDIGPHADSPLGKFRSERGEDPKFGYLNTGLGPGFGGSTAELIAGFTFSTGKRPDFHDLFPWYRKAFPEASGADLAVQLQSLNGKESLEAKNAPDEFSVFSMEALDRPRSLNPGSGLDKLVILRGGIRHKLPTHQDLLQVRPPVSVPLINEMVEEFEAALEGAKGASYKIMNGFADYLRAHARETDYANHIRTTLSTIPGVIGVKGCGAGLNDHFLVALDPGSAQSTVIPALVNSATLLGLQYLGKLGDFLW